MEGYAENGAGTDVTDQIGFGGMRRKRRKHRGLTVFQLKVIGAVALFFSAGSTTIVPLFFGSDLNNMTSLTAVVLSEVASWFAIPIYAWLLVRGFRETHNRVAYGVQLLLLALICEVPYDFATSGKTFDFNSQNPVFGLFIAFVVLAALEWVAAFLLRGVVPGIGIQLLAGIQVGIQASQVRKHSCIFLVFGYFQNILLVPSVEG